MNPLYEKYFHGELSDAERSRLEQELAQDAEARAQFEADQALFGLLKDQMLRKKLQAALGEPPSPTHQPGTGSRWFWVLGLVGLGLVGWLVLREKEAPKIQNWPTETPAPQQAPVQQQPNVPIVEQQSVPEPETKAPAAQQDGQIAEVTVEPHSLQGLRGSEGDSTPWGQLVKRIWYAPFPGDPNSFGPLFKPAAQAISNGNFTDGLFLLGKLGKAPFEVYKKENGDSSWALVDKIEKRLAPTDTLAFLRGYCMMHLWEGKPAIHNFNQLSDNIHPWQEEVEWYTGLCHLLTGEKAKAVDLFKKIAAQPKHAYREPAKKALKLLN